MGWLFALGLLAIVLATSTSAAQTTGTAVLTAGGTYELIATAPKTAGELDWSLPEHQSALIAELKGKGAESVLFQAQPDGSTLIRLVQRFPSGGSIPLGTLIYSNAKLTSVRRVS